MWQGFPTTGADETMSIMSHSFVVSLRTCVVATALLAGSSLAADTSLVIAGGALDTSFTGADVYQGVPAPAQPKGKACEAAQSYLDRINAGHYEQVADLFEADGITMDPGRHTARGRAAIHAFYNEHIRELAPKLIAVAFVGDDQDCMLEIASQQTIRGVSRYVLVSVDHFTLGHSGKIARMVAFARPPRQQ